MAEIAGLSLAASMFQLVKYGGKFTMVAYKIRESGNDAITDFSGLQILSKNLDEVTQRLELASPQAPTSYTDEALIRLVHEWKKASTQMLKTVDKIGLPKSGKIKKRDALQTASRLIGTRLRSMRLQDS